MIGNEQRYDLRRRRNEAKRRKEKGREERRLKVVDGHYLDLILSKAFCDNKIEITGR